MLYIHTCKYGIFGLVFHTQVCLPVHFLEGHLLHQPCREIIKPSTKEYVSSTHHFHIKFLESRECNTQELIQYSSNVLISAQLAKILAHSPYPEALQRNSSEPPTEQYSHHDDTQCGGENKLSLLSLGIADS